MRTPFAVLLAAALATTACGPSGPAKAPGAEGTFNFDYASADGVHAVRTVKQSREVTVVGAPFHASEEMEATWQVDIHKEKGGRVLLQQQVSRLRLAQNGATVLDAQKLPGAAIIVDTHLDERGNVVEMAGTDRVARALIAMAPPEAQKAAAEAITEDTLKQLFTGRFDLVVRDIIGRPSAPGSKWDGEGGDEVLLGRHLEVQKHEPCGKTTCARVVARYDVDQHYSMLMAAHMIAKFALENGLDPRGVVIKNVKATVGDTMVLEPATMLLHAADFDEEIKMTVVGPKQEWDLVVKGKRSVTVEM